MEKKQDNQNKAKKKKIIIIAASLLSVAVIGSATAAGVVLSSKTESPVKQDFIDKGETPPIIEQTEDEKLETNQPIILPEDFTKTNFTDTILSFTSGMTDAAEVAYTSTVIKDELNTKYAKEIDATILSVSLTPAGNFTPVRYNVKLTFDKDPKNLEGFTKDASGAYVSTTYYPSKVLSQNVLKNQFQGFNQQALYYSKVVKTHPRTPVTETYQTSLMTQYKHYGFLYPGYNCNYELDAEHGNKNVPNGYLHLDDGTQIDMAAKVMEEAPPSLNSQGKPYPGGYADPEFIKTEIEFGILKRHPAANNFYSKNVQNDTPAVDTQFTMSTAPSGPQALGLYAPAGEVMTLQFTKEQFDKFKAANGSIEIQINENYWDAKPRGDSGMVSNRYPRIRSYFRLDSSNWDEMTPENGYTFKFGTPFGGNISISFANALHYDQNTLSFGDPIQFTINNAVKSLTYVDGFTTEADWNKQIEEVKNGTITSPNLAIVSTLYSANIPFSDQITHTCGKVLIDDFIYPKEVAKKWDNFLLLSNNFAGRYQGPGRARILDMKFCDDIWGSAAAWGGGMIFYCPIEWGASSFLTGGDPVNFDNWGTLHEINHNFEQNAAFFKAQSHPETNTVNLFDMSVISNAGKYRTELNLNDNFIEPDWIDDPYAKTWIKLSSPFNVMRIIREKIEQTKTNPNMDMTEWAWYAALLYTVGSYRFAQFTNYNVNNFSNKDPKWTPVKFIKFMSDYFKTNMWNLCKITPRWASISSQPWPRENELTKEERQIIKSLEKYPAIDFIGNQYAVGQYMFNAETNEYDYTTDVTTPFEIPALHPYNFNFENYIVCDNENFEWDTLEFNPVSRCGGTLELDPTNSKRLIYTPNPKAINQVDEFNIKITPTKESLKKLPNNYVPGYAWKIKVRQNINSPVVQSYLPIEWQNKPDNAFYDEIFDAMGIVPTATKEVVADENKLKVQPYSLNPVVDMNPNLPNMALTLGKTSFCTYEFNYVVPKTGTYYMWTKYEDGVRILIDGKQVYQNVLKNNNVENKAHDYVVYDEPLNWTKDEVHKIQIGVVNRTPGNWHYEKGYINVQFTDSNITTKDKNTEAKAGPKPGGTPYAIDNQVLVPWLDTKDTSLDLMHNYLYSKEFKYKNREIDFHLYESTSRKMTSNYAQSINYNEYNFVDIEPSKTTIKPEIGTSILKNDREYKISSPWFYAPHSTRTYVPSLINATFNTPQTLSGLEITLPNNDASKALAPQYWLIKLTRSDGTEIPLPVGGDGTLPTSNIKVNFDTTYTDIKKVNLSIFHVSEPDEISRGVIINQVKFLEAADTYIADNQYNFTFTPFDVQPKQKDYVRLKNSTASRYEDWSPVSGDIPNTNQRYNVVKTAVEFFDPQNINTISFSRGDNHHQCFPNYYKLKIHQADGQIIDLPVYHNENYGNYVYFLKLDKVYTNVTRIDIEMYRVYEVEDSPKDGVVLGQIRFFSTRPDLDNAFGINDSSIKLSGDLYYEPNNPQENYSNINGVYLKSNAQGDVIEFTLTNTQAFKILGRKDPNDGTFSVFVNDKEVATNVSCQNDTREINIPIFEYSNNAAEQVLKVKIVNTSNKPIYLNSILLFGEKTKIY